MPDLSLKPAETLLSESAIIERLDAAKVELITYQACQLENWDQCNMAEAIGRRRDSITHETDQATLLKIGSEINALKGLGQEGEHAANTRVINAFAPAKAAMISLLQTAASLVTGYRATAQAAEEAFFATYGQPSQRTSVSSRYTVALNELNAMITALQSANWTTPPDPCGQPALRWFRVFDPLH